MALWVYWDPTPYAGDYPILAWSGLWGKDAHPVQMWIGLLLFLFGEVMNFYTHLKLRDLRPKGTRARGIPHGYGFDIVTCPNYMFEAIAWFGVVLVSQSLSSVLFLAVAVCPLGVWAKKKEMRYRKEFPDKYKMKRFCFIPGAY